MTKPKLSSLNLGKAVDDNALTDYATSRGVPTLKKAQQNTDATTPPPQLVAPRPTRAPTEGVKAVLPDYLAQELRIESAKRKVTNSFLIIEALKEKGYHVEDNDLCEDFRRPNSSAK